MANFYHIMILPSRAQVAKSIPNFVQKKVDLALDWIRIDDRNWIVYSTSNAKKWYARLAPLMKSGGRFWVVRIDLKDRAGWMPKTFWNWIIQKRGGPAGPAAPPAPGSPDTKPS